MPYPIKKLGEIVDILDNQRKPISTKERDKRIEGKSILYPYYGATQQNGVIDDYLFNEELVLLGEDGVDFYNKYKHKAYLISGKTWVNNHAHVLRGKEGILLNKFLLNYLNIFDYHGYVSGATRLKLNQSSMKNISIPLPPLPTQKLIVQKLDSAFKNIDESIKITKKNIENLGELNKSALNNFGNFKKVLIGDIVEKLFAGGDLPKDKSFSREKTKEYTVPIYANAIKEDGLYGYTHTAKVSDDCITISARGTIGFTKIRTIPFYPIVRLLVLIPKKEIADLKYLEYIINTINLKQFGSSIPQLSVPQLKNFEIPLPPLKKQKEIVSYLDDVFEKNKIIKEGYEKKLKELEEMKQSILKEAFEGRLVKE